MASRYPQFWHCQVLHGLTSDEQRQLFHKLGLVQTDVDGDLLSRIGAFFDGHPLVLQVIANEIRQPPFRGNIARYWHHYDAEFTPSPASTSNALARSRRFRRRVRQRVEHSLQRLPDPARQMLCASAVFRRPVPIEFWQAMLPDNDPQIAFDTLQERHLVEYSFATDNTELVRQHNLIRSVAYDQLKADPLAWKTAEHQAAALWLNAYEPPPNAPNLETVRGYLEAFDHYCEVEDWEHAAEIYMHTLETTNQALHWQLLIWANYQELRQLSARLAPNASAIIKIRCFLNLGNAYQWLSDYHKAIDWYEQALSTAQEIGVRKAFPQESRLQEGKALGNLGIAYYSLGQYERAIDFHEQQLTIVREMGVRKVFPQESRNGEGRALGNLGLAYYSRGQYERAIDFYEQYLRIAREMGDRNGEGRALNNLGLAYHSLGQYERAIDFYEQRLMIAREIGDRRGEGIGMGNLGETQLELKQYSESLNNNQSALEIFREIGDRAGEAEALKNLAALHHALGEIEAAREYCQQALALATELGIPLQTECEELNAQLNNKGLA